MARTPEELQNEVTAMRRIQVAYTKAEELPAAGRRRVLAWAAEEYGKPAPQVTADSAESEAKV